MGYIRHHAIIVTSWNDDQIKTAHTKAVKIGFEHVSEIFKTQINGYLTFFIPPDGSKEGWCDSDEGDRRRDEFIGWLNDQRYDDISSPLKWAEVQYGDDDGEAEICRHTDSPELQLVPEHPLP